MMMVIMHYHLRVPVSNAKAKLMSYLIVVRASPAVLDIPTDSAKIFLISKFCFFFVFFFLQPYTWKLKLGQQIANHLDQSLWWGDNKKKDWAAEVISYLLHSLLQQVRGEEHCWHHLPATAKCAITFWTSPKPFSWAKPAHFVFSFILCTIAYSAPLEML